MKRILLICFLAPFFCMGQTVDTIMIGTEVLHKEYPLDTVNYYDPYYISEHYDVRDVNTPASATTLIRPCTINPGTPVYGVAVTCYYPILDSIWPTYGIMTKEGDNWIVLDSANFDSYRVVCAYNYGNDRYGHSNPQYCYEYYFDNPVMVNGPVYIGLLNTINHSQARFGSTLYNKHFTIPSVGYGDPNIVEGIWYAKHPLNGTWIENTSSDWQWRSSFGGFFPIVEPDSLLCGAVENFRLEERGDGYAVVAWHPSRPFEGLYSGRYQVAVGGLGPAPDTSNILTFADTTATVTGLDSGVWYSLWVRGECDHGGCPMHGDTLIWSPWRGPLQFYLGSRQPGSQGIAWADGPMLTLAPNPATESIVIESPGGMLQLLDSEGREVMARRLHGGRATVDISMLPRGVYTVRLTTAEGVASRQAIFR